MKRKTNMEWNLIKENFLLLISTSGLGQCRNRRLCTISTNIFASSICQVSTSTINSGEAHNNYIHSHIKESKYLVRGKKARFFCKLGTEEKESPWKEITCRSPIFILKTKTKNNLSEKFSQINYFRSWIYL